MTGLTPEQRFENHKQGIKAARIVKRCGERLVPRLYAHLNPMPYAKAVEMEVDARRQPPQARLRRLRRPLMQPQLPFDALQIAAATRLASPARAIPAPPQPQPATRNPQLDPPSALPTARSVPSTPPAPVFVRHPARGAT